MTTVEIQFLANGVVGLARTLSKHGVSILNHATRINAMTIVGLFVSTWTSILVAFQLYY